MAVGVDSALFEKVAGNISVAQNGDLEKALGVTMCRVRIHSQVPWRSQGETASLDHVRMPGSFLVVPRGGVSKCEDTDTHTHTWIPTCLGTSICEVVC